ncbi:MAG: hypothetical protein RQM90_07390 [Methanoculleus sp.]
MEWARRGGWNGLGVISIATEKTGELKDCNGTDDDDRDYKNDDDLVEQGLVKGEIQPYRLLITTSAPMTAMTAMSTSNPRSLGVDWVVGREMGVNSGSTEGVEVGGAGVQNGKGLCASLSAVLRSLPSARNSKVQVSFRLTSLHQTVTR